MAIRPVFVMTDAKPFVNQINQGFEYYPGFALSQSQKSVQSLHNTFIKEHPNYKGKVLEISSKSLNPLGVQLSAFNLKYTMSNGRVYTVETVFQSAKCFENGCQYIDLLGTDSYAAKKDERLRTSGNVIAFKLEEKEFPIMPTTFFYDWLYINALHQNSQLAEQVVNYSAFTDIAFNPAKSFNCQARSAAVFVSLVQQSLLTEALNSPESFLKLVYHQPNPRAISEIHIEQLSLFDS